MIYHCPQIRQEAFLRLATTSGQFTCNVSYKDQIIQFGTATYPCEPDYIVYRSKNLFEDTPESLEDGGVFSYEATSVPEGDVNATFVFNPIDIEYFTKARF